MTLKFKNYSPTIISQAHNGNEQRWSSDGWRWKIIYEKKKIENSLT